jgi:hypothetical protein
LSESAGDAAKVLTGLDGHLFLTNDTNRVIDQIEGRFVLEPRQLWGTGLAHAARRALCAAHGCRYDHIIVPDRETLLSQFLPTHISPGREGPRPIEQYVGIGADRVHQFAYDLEILRAAHEEPSLFKGDTHWTCDGAVRYMRTVLPPLGIDLSAYDGTTIKSYAYQNPGDLGVKIGALPETASIRMPESPVLKAVYDNNLPNLGRMRLYLNRDQPETERWLILHDSFGEWLTLMLPLLAHTTCFAHMPDFDELFVIDFKATRVIYLQIERFFVRQPLNGMDFDRFMLEQAQTKVEDFKAPEGDALALLFPNGRGALRDRPLP